MTTKKSTLTVTSDFFIFFSTFLLLISILFNTSWLYNVSHFFAIVGASFLSAVSVISFSIVFFVKKLKIEENDKKEVKSVGKRIFNVLKRIAFIACIVLFYREGWSNVGGFLIAGTILIFLTIVMVKTRFKLGV